MADTTTDTTADAAGTDDKKTFIAQAQETVTGAASSVIEAVKDRPVTAAAAVAGAAAAVAGAAYGVSKLRDGDAPAKDGKKG